MTLKRLFALLLLASFVLSACSSLPAPTTKEATAVATARPTHTASPVPTLAPTFTPAPPIITLVGNTNCYTGPGTGFGLVTTIEIDPEGESPQFYLLGVSNSYWLIQVTPEQQCWVLGQYDLGSTITQNVNMATLAPTATPAPVTEAPLPVASIYLKKAKCTLDKVQDPLPHYEVTVIFIISWDDVAGEDGYRLYRDGNLIANLPPNTTQFDESFLLIKGGRTSTFYIVAFNSFGETRSAQFSFTNAC